MSIVWLTIIIVSFIAIIFLSPDSLLPALLTGTENGINLAFTLIPIYIVWSGIITIMDATGISKKIAKFLSPLINRLFPHENETARVYIAMNFSANLLGAGGAGTPLGIKAIESMQKDGSRATPSMVLFAVINTTSIQLIPTTIISLLTSNGASNPQSIILPTLIISTLSTLLAVLIWSITCKNSKKTPLKKWR